MGRDAHKDRDGSDIQRIDRKDKDYTYDVPDDPVGGFLDRKVISERDGENREGKGSPFRILA